MGGIAFLKGSVWGGVVGLEVTNRNTKCILGIYCIRGCRECYMRVEALVHSCIGEEERETPGRRGVKLGDGTGPA